MASRQDATWYGTISRASREFWCPRLAWLPNGRWARAASPRAAVEAAPLPRAPNGRGRSAAQSRRGGGGLVAVCFLLKRGRRAKTGRAGLCVTGHGLQLETSLGAPWRPGLWRRSASPASPPPRARRRAICAAIAQRPAPTCRARSQRRRRGAAALLRCCWAAVARPPPCAPRPLSARRRRGGTHVGAPITPQRRAQQSGAKLAQHPALGQPSTAVRVIAWSNSWVVQSLSRQNCPYRARGCAAGLAVPATPLFPGRCHSPARQAPTVHSPLPATSSRKLSPARPLLHRPRPHLPPAARRQPQAGPHAPWSCFAS